MNQEELDDLLNGVLLQGILDAYAGKTHDRGSFAKYLEEEDDE